jgi:hypothetical protein
MVGSTWTLGTPWMQATGVKHATLRTTPRGRGNAQKIYKTAKTVKNKNRPY